MQTTAKGRMGLGRTGRVEYIGLVVKRGIATRGPQHQRNFASLFQRDVAQFDILVRETLKDMQGRVVAQDLFNRGVDRIGGEGAGGRVIFEQAGDPVAKRVYRRLVACVQQQDARADQRIRAQFFAVFFGGDQLGDQVVTRVLATLIDIAAQEGGEICGGGIGGLFGRAGTADLVDGDHIIGPAQQVGPHILWHAK